MSALEKTPQKIACRQLQRTCISQKQGGPNAKVFRGSLPFVGGMCAKKTPNIREKSGLDKVSNHFIQITCQFAYKYFISYKNNHVNQHMHYLYVAIDGGPIFISLCVYPFSHNMFI